MRDDQLARSFKNGRLSRRSAIGASALLLLGAALPAVAQEGAMKPASSAKALVVYFSRSGNTRVIAGTIQRDRKTDIFEIKAATPYPEDYEATVERARIERDEGIEPPLGQRVENLDRYETIYLGFPIWGETAPPVIRSFLRSHDLKGKTIRPFITHGGYGLGNSLSVLASHAPGAKIEQAFVLEADQEKRTISEVDSWLEETVPN